MEKLLTEKEFKRMTEEYDKVKYRCKHCGHRVVIGSTRTRNLCDWCGYWVFKDEKMKNAYKEDNNLVIRKKTGLFIKQLREQKGFSQNDLARMLNISRQAISKWERDITLPSVFTLFKLSTIFGITIDEFLED